MLGLGRFDTGPHPYLELKTEATAAIDLVTAARAAHPELSRTWATLGVSQGGHAALGAAHLQQTYAPDLNFRGAAAVDPASDLEHTLPAATDPGIPIFPSDLAGYISPTGRTILDSIGTLCVDRIGEQVAGMQVGDLLSRPLTDDMFRSALSDYLGVPTSGYDAPLLLLVNAADVVVPSPLHAALAAQLMANGADVHTVVDTGAHGDLSPRMWEAIDQFAARILSTPTQQ
jgi:hypothetical protein